MNPNAIEDLARQLEALRRANRRWQWACAAGLAVAVAALGGGPTALVHARQQPAPGAKVNPLKHLYRIGDAAYDLSKILLVEEVKREPGGQDFAEHPELVGQLYVLFDTGYGDDAAYNYRYFKGQEANTLRRLIKEHATEPDEIGGGDR